MPAGRLDEGSQLETVRSRVGESLSRLRGSLHKVQRQEREADGRFLTWQGRFTQRARRIARHLERIECELAGAAPVDDVRVSLSIVGISVDLEPACETKPF